MKKFLKIFIIVLLVVSAVGTTCYLFFKNMKENDNTTVSIAGILYSENKTKFNNSLSTMSSVVNSDGTDNRLNLIIKTNSNLDEIVEVLASYHIENNTKINNEKISKVLKQVNSSKKLLGKMIDEYNIKKNSTYFDKHLGANDFYSEACNYLVKYARFANLINADLNLNKNCDLKFSMFDVYTQVVMNSFNQTKVENSKVIIYSEYNINKINSIFKMENSIVETKVSPYAVEVNRFVEAYYDCNKTEFAKYLASNISIVTSENQTTKEKIATYYFKQIFNV